MAFTISIQKEFNTTPTFLLKLFRNSTIFRLTSANIIQADFEPNGKFHLTFENRGIIYGRFLKIAEYEIEIDWNVEGFGRPEEKGTLLQVLLKESNDKCLLSLRHSGIILEESAMAKEKSWKEILEEVERITNNI